jgi:hypothetical protein
MIRKKWNEQKYISFLIIYLFITKYNFFLYYFPVKSNGFEGLQGEDDERNIKRNKGKH